MYLRNILHNNGLKTREPTEITENKQTDHNKRHFKPTISVIYASLCPIILSFQIKVNRVPQHFFLVYEILLVWRSGRIFENYKRDPRQEKLVKLWYGFYK